MKPVQVQGEFVVHFECYDFPIDIQSLTVLLEFQLADEGITPVEYLGRSWRSKPMD